MTDEEKDLAQQLEKLKKIEKVKKGMTKDKAKRLRKKKKWLPRKKPDTIFLTSREIEPF